MQPRQATRRSSLRSVRSLKIGNLSRKARPAPTTLRRIRIDKVKSLPHQRLFKIQHHAMQIDKALRIDEYPNRLPVRRIASSRQSLTKRIHPVPLARLRIEPDVVAQPGASTTLNPNPQITL